MSAVEHMDQLKEDLARGWYQRVMKEHELEDSDWDSANEHVADHYRMLAENALDDLALEGKISSHNWAEGYRCKCGKFHDTSTAKFRCQREREAQE